MSEHFSKQGQDLFEKGTEFICPVCQSPLKGETNCPVCHTTINYPDEAFMQDGVYADQFVDHNEMSQIGLNFAKKGQYFNCPNCGHILKGERFCPNCDMKINYPDENAKILNRDWMTENAEDDDKIRESKNRPASNEKNQSTNRPNDSENKQNQPRQAEHLLTPSITKGLTIGKLVIGSLLVLVGLIVLILSIVHHTPLRSHAGQASGAIVLGSIISGGALIWARKDKKLGAGILATCVTYFSLLGTFLVSGFFSRIVLFESIALGLAAIALIWHYVVNYRNSTQPLVKYERWWAILLEFIVGLVILLLCGNIAYQNQKQADLKAEKARTTQKTPAKNANKNSASGANNLLGKSSSASSSSSSAASSSSASSAQSSSTPQAGSSSEGAAEKGEDSADASGVTFKNNEVHTKDFDIKLTDAKIIPKGSAGNENGQKDVLAIWYQTTNNSGRNLDPTSAWGSIFSATQGGKKLNVGALPDSAFTDTQTQNIAKGSVVPNAIAYELDDTTSPVTLTASNGIGGKSVGTKTYNLQ